MKIYIQKTWEILPLTFNNSLYMLTFFIVESTLAIGSLKGDRSFRRNQDLTKTGWPKTEHGH